jgi:hypothetical protein
VFCSMCYNQQVLTYIHTYIHTHTHTHTHTYIPWIHKCVTKTIGCGKSHKYTICTVYSTINILQQYYRSPLYIKNSSTEEKQCVFKYFLKAGLIFVSFHS